MSLQINSADCHTLPYTAIVTWAIINIYFKEIVNDELLKLK